MIMGGPAVFRTEQCADNWPSGKSDGSGRDTGGKYLYSLKIHIKMKKQ